MAKSNANFGRNKTLVALVILASIAMAIAVGDIAISAFMATNDHEFRGYAGQQAVYAQAVAAKAEQAMEGDQQAFQALYSAKQHFNNNLHRVLKGNPNTLMPGAKGDVQKEARLIQQVWSGVRDSISTMVDKGDSVLLAHDVATDINTGLPDVISRWEQIAQALAESGSATDQQVYLAGRGNLLGQRMLNNVNVLVNGNGDVGAAARQLQADIVQFSAIGKALMNGSSAMHVDAVKDGGVRARIDRTNRQFAPLRGSLGTLTSLSTDLIAAHQAASKVKSASGELSGYIRSLQRAYEGQVKERLFQPSSGYIIGGIALVILLITLYIYLLGGDARKAAVYQQRQQERNQEAILRLLDELGSLADGDLTVEVTVTEDITGAIADSINFALEALRDLVRTINDTAVQVDAAARETRATAAELAEASESQTDQITTAGTQIGEMTQSIEQVSANAERSTSVARRSVEIAHNGGDAVRRTIDGMNDIRETIQETSKRIKRLGESSQEIGDIVELINDIAEQTNILALNAAIQASMAGEAGRGFAVVADEVQRLAERSANATRQIEALVKTIQTDTNEAVSSMEQSTSGVVNTAELAENAGSALDEIESVSNNMSTLIQSISHSASEQSGAANGVSKTMSSIQEITSRTSRGTSATARSIGKLAELATELRTSVAGFKLPSGEVLEAEEPTGELSTDDTSPEQSDPGTMEQDRAVDDFPAEKSA